MLVIGITGQFASGKSTVAKILGRKLNAEVIDADKIGHAVLLDRKVKQGLIDYFGTAARHALAVKAFASRANHRALCRITHPLLAQKIIAKIQQMKLKNPNGSIIVDAAVLLEMGLYKFIDRLILVRTNRTEQTKRARRKWGLSETDIKKRLRLQFPVRSLAAKADFIIDNSGTLEETKKQIKKLGDEIWRKNVWR